MASIEKPKARKEYVCSKCGATIKVGEQYVKGTPFRMKPIIRCNKCGLRHWELSSSDYVQGVGRVCDCWEKDYGCDEDTAQSIADELSSILDTTQDSLDNMPEGLQEGDTGQLLQERIDNLDSAINDLECIDYETLKDNARDDVDSDEGTDEYETELEEKTQEALREEIESALSCLDY